MGWQTEEVVAEGGGFSDGPSVYTTTSVDSLQPADK